MNEFWVEFSEKTTIEQITKGLDAVPAENIEEQDGIWYFDAEWGTTQKDLNNLKGRIETGGGKVIGIGVQDEAKKRLKNTA